MGKEWNSDAELFELVKSELYTPVVGDILDQMERYHQILPQPFQPMKEDMVIVGRAMPSLLIDVYGKQEKPIGKLREVQTMSFNPHRSLRSNLSGEIYAASFLCCSNPER